MGKLPGITIIKQGLYTSIQDKGRNSYADRGIPNGGALDQEAYEQGCNLLGNRSDAPCIESFGHGVKIGFNGIFSIVVTGAISTIKINDFAHDSHQLIHVKKGDTLEISKVRKGNWSYIHIQGEWNVKSWLGSASCYRMKSFIRPEGSFLKKNDFININPSKSQITDHSIKTDYLSERTLSMYEAPESSLLKKGDWVFISLIL